MRKKKTADVPPQFTKSEEDLLWHIENGYQLQTNSLGADPVLRRLKDDEVVRPASANRNTVKALEERGLIRAGKAREPLTIIWQLSAKKKMRGASSADTDRP